MSKEQEAKIITEVDQTINTIGDAHVLCIIMHLAKGGLRFNQLQRAINDLNPTTLTQRLKKLELENFIIRREETVDKLSVVYELTEKGLGILPVIKEIRKFTKKFC